MPVPEGEQGGGGSPEWAPHQGLSIRVEMGDDGMYVPPSTLEEKCLGDPGQGPTQMVVDKNDEGKGVASSPDSCAQPAQGAGIWTLSHEMTMQLIPRVMQELLKFESGEAQVNFASVDNARQV